MPDIYSIKPGTVFAWFMLVLVVRRIILVMMLIISGIRQPSKPASQPVEVARKGNNGKNSNESSSPVESDRAQLINDAITNDSENDTYFLILYFGTAIFSYSVNVDVLRMIVYGAVYLFARIVHSFMLILELQPFRSLAYLIGLFCTFAISMDLVITMSRSSN